MITKSKEEYRKLGKASKRKGNKFEYDVTRHFLSCKFDADKISGSGSSTHRKGDVKVKIGYYNFNFDCKDYKKIGIYKWWRKQKADTERTFTPGLVLKEDYGDELVVIRLKDFCDIGKDLEEVKNERKNKEF